MDEIKKNADEPKATENTGTESKNAEQKADRRKLKKLEAETAELKKQLEAAKAETAEANDKYLRMMAEYDNFRKRSAKEKDGVYADATMEQVAITVIGQRCSS